MYPFELVPLAPPLPLPPDEPPPLLPELLLLLLLLLFLLAFAISSSLLSIAALSFSNWAKSACKSFASPSKSSMYFSFYCLVAFNS